MKLVISFIPFLLLAVFAKTTIAQTHLPECEFNEKTVVTKIPCYGIRTVKTGDKTTNYGVQETLTGTITVANSTTTLYGFGTKFQSELHIGDLITWTNDADTTVTKIVKGISLQTELEVSVALGGSDVTTKASFFLKRIKRMGWLKGTIYEGEFHNGMANGFGSFTLPGGSYYIGDWKNDKMHGQGEYTWANGSKYVGEWKNNQMDGFGIINFKKGGLEFNKGFHYKTGEKYAGDWKNNNMHGQGTFSWGDGTKYIGKWENNIMKGKGIKTFPDGRIYEGLFRKNLYDGQGSIAWPDGYKLIGEWQKMKMARGRSNLYYGTLILQGGGIYTGQWKEDKFSEDGTMIYPNGSKFEGKWLRGKRFGKGTLIYPNGKKYTGMFNEGILGNGIYKYGNIMDFWNGIFFWIYAFTK